MVRRWLDDGRTMVGRWLDGDCEDAAIVHKRRDKIPLLGGVARSAGVVSPRRARIDFAKSLDIFILENIQQAA
jgi:hypothetical protein